MCSKLLPKLIEAICVSALHLWGMVCKEERSTIIYLYIHTQNKYIYSNEWINTISYKLVKTTLWPLEGLKTYGELHVLMPFIVHFVTIHIVQKCISEGKNNYYKNIIYLFVLKQSSIVLLRRNTEIITNIFRVKKGNL